LKNWKIKIEKKKLKLFAKLIFLVKGSWKIGQKWKKAEIGGKHGGKNFFS